MKFLVVIAVACFAQSALGNWAGYGAYNGGYGNYGQAAAPVVTPSGFLADTPEVAHAKAAHLAQVAKAGGAAHVPYAAGYAGAGAYHGVAGVTPAGYLADTPEVAAAKAAHFAEVAKASGAAGYAGAGAGAGAYYGYHAGPVVTPSGYLADTPEVAAAKAAHLNLVAQAGNAGAYSGAYYGGGHYAGNYAGQYSGAYDDGQYSGAYDDGQYSGDNNDGHYSGAYNGGQYAGAHNEGQYVPDKNNW